MKTSGTLLSSAFKGNRSLLLIFLCALALRAAYVLQLGTSEISPDAASWLAAASDIASGRGYGNNWREPLYPLFLVLAGAGGGDLLTARLAQSLLGALTCVLVFSAGRSIFGRRVGLIAAAVTAFYPYLVYYAGDILRETLYSFLITACVAALLKYEEDGKPRWAALCGLAAGLTVLCKGSFLPVLLLAPAWLVFRWRVDGGAGRLRAAALLLGVALLTLLPWGLRNLSVHGRFMLAATSPGYMFWMANNPLSETLEDVPRLDVHRLPDEYVRDFDPEVRDRILKLPPAQADKAFMKEALAFITGDPAGYMRLMAKRLVHYWRLYPVVATRANKTVALLTSGWIIPLGLLGMALSFRTHWRRTGFPLLLIAFFTLTHTVLWAMIRFRVPIDPLVIIFCGYTLSLAWDRLAAKRAHA